MCGSFDAIHSIHFLCRLPSEEIGGDPFLARSSLTQYIKSVSDNRATLDFIPIFCGQHAVSSVSYTHLRAHETDSYLVCRLLLEKKKNIPLTIKKKKT